MNKMSQKPTNMSRVLLSSNNGITFGFGYYKDGMYNIDGNDNWSSPFEFDGWCTTTQLRGCLKTMKSLPNHSVIDGDTLLVITKEINTPYNTFRLGDYSNASHWAEKFGKTTEEFISDFNNRNFDDWFKVYTE